MKRASNVSFALAALFAMAPGLTAAQTFEGNVSSYESPLGMRSVTDIDSPAAARRDENGNLVVVRTPGWGFSATAVGNLINVVTEGSNNTVVINANQVNKGSQRAYANVKGGSDDSSY